MAASGIFPPLLLLGSFENINCDQDDIIFADIAVIVRRVLGRRRGVAGMQYLRAAVGEPNLVCSLPEINSRRPIFVAMHSYVTARFNCEYAHPKLPASHTFNLRT
jgi:hypothetical protein